MEAKDKVEIAAAEVVDGRLQVSFSDNTTASFAAEDLLGIAADRIDSGIDKAGG